MREPPLSSLNWKGFPTGATILRIGERVKVGGQSLETVVLMWTEKNALRKGYFLPLEAEKEWRYLGECLKLSVVFA